MLSTRDPTLRFSTIFKTTDKQNFDETLPSSLSKQNLVSNPEHFWRSLLATQQPRTFGKCAITIQGLNVLLLADQLKQESKY